MLKTKDELKEWYENLTKKYEGYIQMSDSKIESKHLFKTAQTLPKWEDIHNEINYIVEMALYQPDTKNSILVRQQNNGWLVIEKELSGKEEIDTYFTLTENTPKMKIAQIWEEEPNEFCLNLKVLEPKYLLFAGFEGGKS
jgi:CRISPR type III-associated protein (TIGR04423 family)